MPTNLKPNNKVNDGKAEWSEKSERNQSKLSDSCHHTEKYKQDNSQRLRYTSVL